MSCIKWFGALPQWSADRTEYSHIDFVKRPKSKTNGHDYYPQICQQLDRAEKIWFFSLATAHFQALVDDSSDPDPDDDAITCDKSLSIHCPPAGTRRLTPDFFTTRPPASHPASAPLRTFVMNKTAFCINVKPDVKQMSVEDAAVTFRIPDLHISIRDWFISYLTDPTIRTISGRQGSAHDILLPFMGIRVWDSVQVQNYGATGGLHDPQRLFAQPPSNLWPFGRYDTALFCESIDGGPELPGPGLDGSVFSTISTTLCSPRAGFFVGQIRLIFHPIWEAKSNLPLYLAYTGGKGAFTQQAHGEFIVSSETKCPPNTQ